MQHITALCWALGMVLLLKRVLFQACSPWWTCWWLGLPLCYTCINIHNLRSLTACTWHALRHNLYLELLLHIMPSFIADKKKQHITEHWDRLLLGKRQALMKSLTHPKDLLEETYKLTWFGIFWLHWSNRLKIFYKKYDYSNYSLPFITYHFTNSITLLDYRIW